MSRPRNVGKILGTCVFALACVADVVYLTRTSEDPACAVSELIIMAVVFVAVFAYIIGRSHD